MSKFTKAVAALMLTVAVVCAAGCKKTDDPNNGGDNAGTINPKYVPIDWNNATLLSANDSIGDYQIQFSGEMPDLQRGSIITIDQDTAVYHIFVETVNVDGNTMSITSAEAHLTDIFADVGFTLATNPNASNSKSSLGKVFYPVAAYQQNEQGVYKSLDLTAHRDDGWGFTHDLWQITGNYDGLEILSGNHYDIYMERLNYNFDIDFEMYMNFSGRTVREIVGNALEVYRSKALNVNAYLLGNFYTEQMVRCDITGSCSYDLGYEIWKHNLFRPLNVKFVVFGVPVVIKLNSDLYRQVVLEASGEISAYTGFTDNVQGRLGFEWYQTQGMNSVATFSNTFNYTPPTLEGRGKVSAKVWVFPRVRALVYGVVGPSFDFKPYLSATVTGGFREQMLGQTNDYCAWSLDCNAGLDGGAGLSLQFMGYEIENYAVPDWNIVDKPLYHSPKRVTHISKGDAQGPRGTESFYVFDQNYLLNSEVLTPLPQIVKFEANGQLSSKYGIVRNGQVSVTWTPEDNDVLYAKLYDIDGNVIACDEVTTGGGGGGGTTSYSISATANPANGGTVSGGGTYEQGQSCTVSATANTGYTFANWTENGIAVSTNANYTFTVSGDRTLVANFTANGGGGGGFDGQIVMERKYYIHHANNYSHPSIHFLFDNNQVLSIGYLHANYWMGSYNNHISGIHVLSSPKDNNGGYANWFSSLQTKDWYIAPCILDAWVNEKVIIYADGRVRYYINDEYMGEEVFDALHLQDAGSVEVYMSPWGWWTGHYTYVDDFFLQTPAMTISDDFNDGEINLNYWRSPVNPDGVVEEEGVLKMLQLRTDQDFQLISKTPIPLN